MYLRELLGREDGAPPPVDLALERKTGDFIRSLIESGEVIVVHDLSDGGLIAAAAEIALASNTGLKLDLAGDLPAHAQLFGEDQGRYLIATTGPEALIAKAKAAGLAARLCAKAEGDALSVTGLFDIPLSQLRDTHEGWLPAYMG